jgi:hypothetical protein
MEQTEIGQFFYPASVLGLRELQEATAKETGGET